jgi:hypothetical protein
MSTLFQQKIKQRRRICFILVNYFIMRPGMINGLSQLAFIDVEFLGVPE